jgi:hypothetical protein
MFFVVVGLSVLAVAGVLWAMATTAAECRIISVMVIDRMTGLGVGRRQGFPDDAGDDDSSDQEVPAATLESLGIEKVPPDGHVVVQVRLTNEAGWFDGARNEEYSMSMAADTVVGVYAAGDTVACVRNRLGSADETFCLGGRLACFFRSFTSVHVIPIGGMLCFGVAWVFAGYLPGHWLSRLVTGKSIKNE